MQIRSPICTVVGHVDHGKTSLLDSIRGTAITKTEPGLITQAIGASIIPLEVIKKICGALLEKLQIKFTIPGLLLIDTPGHAAFTSLRKRGGNLADIAILVIDINEGFKPQTEECIEILKAYKTPFVVAANKIDLLKGWQTKKKPLLETLSLQPIEAIEEIETKLYALVSRFKELGFEADRFDRVKDYTRQIAIIPTSAHTGDGIPELLMVITGLAQKYLEQQLKTEVKGPARGTILEVKEEKGLGTVLDAIIYDGTIKINDFLVIGGLEKPITTKVRALLQPAPLSEMRYKKTKFTQVKEAAAATGIRISAPGIEEALAGMPIATCREEDLEKTKEQIQKEVQEVIIETKKQGVIVKADSLGSLEALDNLLKNKSIPIRSASIGSITRKDIIEAETNLEKDPLHAAVLAFNVTISPDAAQIAAETKVKIFTNNVIYQLLEDFEAWQETARKAQEAEKLEALVAPCKIKLLPGYVFRQSNPAIVGIEVLAGTLKTGTPLMNEAGREIAAVKSIQLEQESIEKAETGKQVALALPGVIVGRQIKEGDILLSSIPEEDFRRLKELKHMLTKQQIDLLKEIAEIKRKTNPAWGI